MRGKSRFRQTKFIKPRYRNRHQVESIIAQRYREVEEQIEEEDLILEPQISNGKTLRELLRTWTNCHGITTRAVNDLLRILIISGIVK